MRFVFVILLAVCSACASRHAETQLTATIIGPYHPPAPNPADWGPAYTPGMEFGPAEVHLSRAFGQAEAFLATHAFAKHYAKRACSGGGGRFVDVHFALLSDASGRTIGTVRVDTDSGECVWLGSGH